MIYLLHGPDTVSSRNFLIKLKEGYEVAETVEAKAFAKKQTEFYNTPLFGEKKILVIENFVQEEKVSLKVPLGLDVVLWSPVLVKVPTWVGKNLLFKGREDSTFKFADAVGFGQVRTALSSLERLLSENVPNELLIGSLSRQLRLLSLGLNGSWSSVSTSSFVQNKIREQLGNWNRTKLKKAALLLLKADWEIKTGKSSGGVVLTLTTLKICSLVST